MGEQNCQLRRHCTSHYRRYPNNAKGVNGGKAIPVPAWTGPRVSGVEAPRFQDNRHMKVVRLLALHTGRLYPQKMLLVLMSVRDRVDSWAIVRPE